VQSQSHHQEQEASLDAQISSVMAALKAVTDHPANKPYLFVTDEDITSLPCFAKVHAGCGGGGGIGFVGSADPLAQGAVATQHPETKAA